MSYHTPFAWFPAADLFDTLLPDFVLAFTFFTALTYAVLGRRFDHQRPAVAMSAALGMALSIGLVAWSHQRGWSVKNLGPLAVGFALILLGMIMYQAIKQVGGSWAGAGIAVGASILVAWVLGVHWPVATQIIQTLATTAFVVGLVAFLIHAKRAPGLARLSPGAAKREASSVRHDLSDLYEDRRVGEALKRGLRRARGDADRLPQQPDVAGDIMRRLKRMLPAEGWLTERLAALRAKAYLVRKGHVARIKDLREAMASLPAPAKKQASLELAERYTQLRLDTRLERLDSSVAGNERQIKALTQQAKNALAQQDQRGLVELLSHAEKLQTRNSRLLKAIARFEKKLSDITQQVAQQAREATRK